MGQKVGKAPSLVWGKGNLPLAHAVVADHSVAFPSRPEHPMGWTLDNSEHWSGTSQKSKYGNKAGLIVGPTPKTPETTQANLLSQWDTLDPNTLPGSKDKTGQIILTVSRSWRVCVLQTYSTWQQSWITGFNNATTQLTTPQWTQAYGIKWNTKGPNENLTWKGYFSSRKKSVCGVTKEDIGRLCKKYSIYLY